MILLVLGIALWTGAHLFKRVAPEPRAAMGDAGRALVAAGVLGGLVLMVIGYRSADFVYVWGPAFWTIHINNLLMVVAVLLFGMGHSRGHMRSWMRHPMLAGAATWAVAHLVVNGDLASMVLFGGMLSWALGEMVLINRLMPVWDRPEPGPVTGDFKLVVGAIVLYAVISGVHAWLGVYPFAG